MWSSRLDVSPIFITSVRPASDFSAGVAVESTCGAKPARSRRYNAEHSAQRPVAGHVESLGPATAVACVGAAESVLAGDPLDKIEHQGVCGLCHVVLAGSAGIHCLRYFCAAWPLPAN